MKIRAKDFFSTEQKERIRQAVQAAEEATSGEIAVMLVHESDRYREAELAGALSFSALAALVLCLVFRYTSIWFYIPISVVLLPPFLYLFRRWPHMKLAFLRHRRVEEAVRERAVYAFFQKGVHKTEEETGILIFISLLERKVWILGDRGIHGKIGSDYWRTLAGELAAGIREDRAFEALCEVIRKCGAELARHFPNRSGAHQSGEELICE
jgi:putative membrane protein